MSETRVLIKGNSSFMSGGVQAMVISSIMVLNEFIPNAKFTILSRYPQVERRLYERYAPNLKVIKVEGGRLKSFQRMLRAILWGALHRLGLKIDVLLTDELLQEYVKADVIVYLPADAFSYDIGKAQAILVPIEVSLDISLGSFLKKPVILFPFSAGPFRSKIVTLFARFAFNRSNAIFAREEITRDYLRTIGVSNMPIHLVADVAFALRPAPNETVSQILRSANIDKGGALIGINVSQLLSYKSRTLNDKNEYLELMAQLADYFADHLGATVILIPHEIYPRGLELVGDARIQGGDDITAIRRVFKKVKNKEKVVPLTGEYTAPELKGIIARCNLFVGARAHSIIAAISMCVPTLAIAYSVKAEGIMKMVHLDEYVCNFRNMSLEKIKIKTNDLWNNKEDIKNHLSSFIQPLKESLRSIGKLTVSVLNS